jgi:hypothetical protein
MIGRVRGEQQAPEISAEELAAAGWSPGNGAADVEPESWRLASVAPRPKARDKGRKEAPPEPPQAEPEPDDAEAAEPRTRQEKRRLLAQLNKQFAITWGGGKAVFVREYYDHQMHRPAVDFVRQQDFATFYANKFVYRERGRPAQAQAGCHVVAATRSPPPVRQRDHLRAHAHHARHLQPLARDHRARGDRLV